MPMADDEDDLLAALWTRLFESPAGLTNKAICAAFQLDSTTVTRLLERLQQQNAVVASASKPRVWTCVRPPPVDHGSVAGIDLDKALAMARDLGCVIEDVRRTGEARVTAPNGDSVKLNKRRKDAPRSLVSLINQLRRR